MSWSKEGVRGSCEECVKSGTGGDEKGMRDGGRRRGEGASRGKERPGWVVEE